VRLPSALLRLLGRRPAVRGPGVLLDVAVPGHHIANEDTPELAVTKDATPTPSLRSPHRRMRGSAWLRRWINPALHGAVTPACLLARLENGVEVIYTLDADGRAQRVSEVPDGCPLVLSATSDDHRLGLSSPLTHQAAKSRLVRESGVFEPLAVVTARDAVYGTPVARVAEWSARGIRLAPLSALADRLSAQHGALDPDLPSVTGFVFGRSDGSGSIAVFFSRSPDGKSASYVSINPEDLSAVLEAFYNEAGLPEDSASLGFEQKEALDALKGFYSGYPASSDLLGIPTRLAWRGALVLSALACAGSGAWWMSINQEIESTHLATEASKAREDQHLAEVSRKVAADPAGFAQLMGLDPAQALTEAESLYLTTSRVESTITATERQHDVFVPLRHEMGEESPLGRALNLSHKGCVRSAIEYSGGLDEIRLRFRCPGSNIVVGAFRR